MRVDREINTVHNEDCIEAMRSMDDAVIDLQPDESLHEANYLKLDCAKARSRLNWQLKWELAAALEMTADWYKTFQLTPDKLLEKTLEQIEDYSKLADTIDHHDLFLLIGTLLFIFGQKSGPDGLFCKQPQNPAGPLGIPWRDDQFQIDIIFA